jgi:DNA polymerase-3 subunit delta
VAARAGGGAGRAGGRTTGPRSGAAAGGELSLSALGQELTAGTLRRIYLLEGEEILLRREVLTAIENAALGPDASTRAFGRQVFPGAEARAEDIIAATAGLPMFGERRLVIVDGVDRLRKNDREALVPALGSVPDTTVLVLIADKLDGRLTSTRDLRARAAVIPVSELPANLIPKWIAARFQALGHTVAPAAAQQLLALAGPTLSSLAGEIEKVSLYVGAKKAVSVEDVNRVVAGGLGSTLDELVNAVGERDLPRALRSLSRVLEAGEEPLRVLGFLNYRISDLWRLAHGHRGWVRDEVRAAARRWSAPELACAIALLYAADRLLKGGEGGEGGMPLPRHRHGDALVLETLLVRILPATPRAAAPPARRR